MCFVMTETQVEGAMIPEAVPVEGAVPEADVLEGATTGPDGPMAPPRSRRKCITIHSRILA
jgi:hypothetical protein